jgi:hypothetical protein
MTVYAVDVVYTTVSHSCGTAHIFDLTVATAAGVRGIRYGGSKKDLGDGALQVPVL